MSSPQPAQSQSSPADQSSSAAQPSPAQRKRATDKAEQILQGTTQVFLAQGYDGTSMDAVAKTAGVSKQTLYVYFADKTALFATLVERMAQQRFQLTVEPESLQGSPNVVLPRLIQRSLDRLTQDSEYHNFLRILIAESKRFPELMQVFFRNVTQPSIQTLRHYLEQHPELNITDAEATAHVLLGSLIFHMLTQEVMAGKATIPMTQERLSNSLIHLLGLSS